MTTTLTTTFGPVRTGSTAAFIAVAKRHEGCRIGKAHAAAGITIHARAETEKAIVTRLRREGLHQEGAVWVMRHRAPAPGTPGAIIAEIEVVAR